MTKRELRRSMLVARRRLCADVVRAGSKSIQSRLDLLPPFANAALVLFYVSLPEEVQTDGMIAVALARGKRAAVPAIQEETGRMVAIEVASADFEKRTGRHGISEPAAGTDCPVPLQLIDLVVVPGVAFDPGGGRLGFGGGYYDRFLGRCPLQTVFVGVAFECQLVDRVPLAAHDMLMDYVVTEAQVIRCTQSGG